MLKSILGIILPIFLIITTQTSYADSKGLQRQQEAQRFGSENKVAIVVGVNNYDHYSGLRPLQYAVSDAHSLKSSLEKHGYNVRLLTDQKANSGYILDAIEQAGKTLNHDQGTLIFAFSGHGFARSNTNFLASYGTVSSRIESTALSMKQVENAIQKTGVRRGLMFIDACRDNPSTKGSKSIANPSFIHQQSEGLQILYSTKFGDVSWESPKLQHGVFSYFLQKALDGKATDNTGIISFAKLKQYVQQQVANWTFKNMGKTQRPFSSGESYGVFILGGKTNAFIQAEKKPTKVTMASPVVQNTQTQLPQTPINIATTTHSQLPTEKKKGHYIDHGNGTITDTNTGLMWKKCSEGQSGYNCEIGKALRQPWKELLSKYNKKITFSGYNDWRIPTIKELRTLVHCSSGAPKEEAWEDTCAGNFLHKQESITRGSTTVLFLNNENDPRKYSKNYMKPTINPLVFPNTPNDRFCSKSKPLFSSSRYCINFNNGSLGTNMKADAIGNGIRADKASIRLVRNKPSH